MCDHHAPRADGRLPDCEIVHPAVCGYPCVDLCGTGVAYKVAQALGAPGVEDDIELVALATVADLMPLVGENRRLVREGLTRAVAHGQAGPAGADDGVAKADPSALDTRALGVPPRAADQRRGPTSPRRRGSRAAAHRRRAPRRRDRRRARPRSMPSAARSSSGSCGRPRPRSPSSASAAPTCSPARTGTRAWSGSSPRGSSSATIARWSWSRSTETSGSGSARSIPGFDLLGALHATAEHLERYGGHRAAAGTDAPQRPDRRLPARARGSRRGGACPTICSIARERVDAIASGCELGLDLAEELELLEPCGMGNPAQPAARARGAAARSASDGGWAPPAVRGRLGRDQRARGGVRVRREAGRRAR